MATKMDPKMMAALMAKKKAAMGSAPAAAPPMGGMGMKKGGMPMKMKDGKKVPIFMNKGGSASSRADGIAKSGKTKGTQITMKKGGKC